VLLRTLLVNEESANWCFSNQWQTTEPLVFPRGEVCIYNYIRDDLQFIGSLQYFDVLTALSVSFVTVSMEATRKVMTF
jgi:hypothetical protein